MALVISGEIHVKGDLGRGDAKPRRAGRWLAGGDWPWRRIRPYRLRGCVDRLGVLGCVVMEDEADECG